jgi:hypothetical protein
MSAGTGLGQIIFQFRHFADDPRHLVFDCDFGKEQKEGKP